MDFFFTGSTTDYSSTNLKLRPSAQLKGTVDTIPTDAERVDGLASKLPPNPHSRQNKDMVASMF